MYEELGALTGGEEDEYWDEELGLGLGVPSHKPQPPYPEKAAPEKPGQTKCLYHTRLVNIGFCFNDVKEFNFRNNNGDPILYHYSLLIPVARLRTQ